MDVVDIASVAAEANVVAVSEPMQRPSFLEGLSDPHRNPFLNWETMGGVQMHVWTVRDVVLDGTTMMLVHQGRVIKQSIYQRPTAEVSLSASAPLIEIDDSTPVLICGDAWSSNHYHFLNHTLPAIDVAAARFSAGLRLAKKKTPVAHQRALEILGHDKYPDVLVEPGKRYAIAYAVFCDLTVGVADFANAQLIQSVHSRLADLVPDDGTPASRLYVSRLEATHRRAEGESELIDQLLQRDFTVTECSALSMDQQVNLFRKARFVVGLHGAGLANISFCQPGAVFLEALPKTYAVPSMLNLAMRRGLRVWSDAYPSQSTNHSGDWKLDVASAIARIDEIS